MLYFVFLWTQASESPGVDHSSESILEDRGVIERHRNKQRQRERIRQLEEVKCVLLLGS